MNNLISYLCSLNESIINNLITISNLISSNITMKDIIIVLIGIFSGWLITRIYSKSTEKLIRNTSGKQFKKNIQPIYESLNKIEREFNKITIFYKNQTLEEVEKIRNCEINKAINPIIDLITKPDHILNNQEVTLLIEKAYKTEDSKLLKRALFLGSLLKLDGKSAPIGFKELSSYPPKIFKEFLDYLLAQIVKSNSITEKIYLVTLLRNKIG